MQWLILQIMAVSNCVTELIQKADENPYWTTNLIPFSGSLGHQSTSSNWIQDFSEIFPLWQKKPGKPKTAIPHLYLYNLDDFLSILILRNAWVKQECVCATFFLYLQIYICILFANIIYYDSKSFFLWEMRTYSHLFSTYLSRRLTKSLSFAN